MNNPASTANCDESPDVSLPPIFSNYGRDLAPDIARRAAFVIPIRPSVEDKREHHEKTVAGCEGAACTLADRGAA